MTIKDAILSTLTYHDIFDYPLTLDQIHKFLIGKKASLKSAEKEIRKLAFARVILGTLNEVKWNPESQNALFALKGRKKLFSLRRKRAKYSNSKLKRAKLFSFLLTLIPTIKMVAISGALAMQNSHKNDDIDLMIITSKGTLWTTRFFANLILLPFKRRPQLPTIHYPLLTNNKACLNLFLDEQDLQIHDQNLYTAHELCQLKPLWDRDQTYSRLIKANKWVRKYLPNWQPSPAVIPAPHSVIPAEAGIHKSRGVVNLSLIAYLLSPLETFFKKFQLWYMRKKVSTERLGEHQLFFHPSNTQEQVLDLYNNRLKKLKVNVPYLRSSSRLSSGLRA